MSTPEVEQKPVSISLALSGGGFRATVFHIGVLARLRDAGLLSHVSCICSVSGGSILAARLTQNWERWTETEEDFRAEAMSVLRFIRSSPRTRLLNRMPWLAPIALLFRNPITRHFRGSTWIHRKLLRSGGVRAHLMQSEMRRIVGKGNLRTLNEPGEKGPKGPRTFILATNLSKGTLAAFTNEGIFPDLSKRTSAESGMDFVPSKDLPLALAVTCSAAFPGFFRPITIEDRQLERGRRIGRRFEGGHGTFSDGGIYDNSGVHMAHLLARLGATAVTSRIAAATAFQFGTLFVSDAGMPLGRFHEPEPSAFGGALRATDVMMNRAAELERSQHEEALWMRSDSRVIEAGALHRQLQEDVAFIRTDLDRLSDLEVNALFAHGYAVAGEQLKERKFVEKKIDPDAAFSNWTPFPQKREHVPVRQPSHGGDPEIQDLTERQASRLLAGHKRSWANGLLADWKMTLLNVLVLCASAAFLVFSLLPSTWPPPTGNFEIEIHFRSYVNEWTSDFTRLDSTKKDAVNWMRKRLSGGEEGGRSSLTIEDLYNVDTIESVRHILLQSHTRVGDRFDEYRETFFLHHGVFREYFNAARDGTLDEWRGSLTKDTESNRGGSELKIVERYERLATSVLESESPSSARAESEFHRAVARHLFVDDEEPDQFDYLPSVLLLVQHGLASRGGCAKDPASTCRSSSSGRGLCVKGKGTLAIDTASRDEIGVSGRLYVDAAAFGRLLTPEFKGRSQRDSDTYALTVDGLFDLGREARESYTLQLVRVPGTSEFRGSLMLQGVVVADVCVKF